MSNYGYRFFELGLSRKGITGKIDIEPLFTHEKRRIMTENAGENAYLSHRPNLKNATGTLK
jgi:hypothetical protein